MLPLPGAAQPMTLPADTQVTVLLKVLTYDRHFESRVKPEVVVGIVYVAASAESKAAAEDVGSTFFRFKGKTVKKIPVNFVMVEYTTAAEVEKFLKAKNVKVLYVTPGNSKNLGELVRISQSHGLTTTTGVPEYVKKGITIGVGARRDEKPQIHINLPSSKSEGSEFDASLLQIAEVHK